MDKIIEYMLAEDEGFGDITSNSVVDESLEVNAYIISKDEGILAGMNIAKDIFTNYGVHVDFWLKDGCEIHKKDLLMSVKGNARTILLLERTVLNLIMRMSGVATASSEFVKLVGGKVKIAGTRKTSPAISKFDKYALQIGGADTHRFSLDDMVLIKDNHIATCVSPLDALKKAQSNVSFSKKIEIEVETLNDAVECVRQKADIVMLDNMSPELALNTLNALEEKDLRKDVLIEISGGITEENILDYAPLDVDIISLGSLTHATPSLNFSLDMD